MVKIVSAVEQKRLKQNYALLHHWTMFNTVMNLSIKELFYLHEYAEKRRESDRVLFSIFIIKTNKYQSRGFKHLVFCRSFKTFLTQHSVLWSLSVTPGSKVLVRLKLLGQSQNQVRSLWDSPIRPPVGCCHQGVLRKRKERP